MFPHIIERKIGSDLALINSRTQVLCVLDETGETVWAELKKSGNIENLKQRVEVPIGEEPDFEAFCTQLQAFLDGRISDLSQGMSLHQYFYQIKVPFVIGLEINTRCQVRCKHCYNPQRYPEGEKDKQHIDLPLLVVKDLARDLQTLGTPFVIITGGEPLLHPHFLDICQVLSSSGVALKVFTNGYAMTPEIAKALAEMRIFLVGFTLFGANTQHHEYISQVPGSFARIVNAIKLVKEEDIPVDVTFFLMNHNFDDRLAMEQWANSELAITPSFSFSLTPRETGSREPFELEITPTQMQVFFRETGIARETLQCGDESMVPCTAGKTLASIKANGDVTPCVSLIYPVGNIFQDSFVGIWKDSERLRQFRNLQLSDIEGCANCPHVGICLRCFVNAHILGGNIFGKDPHACCVTNALLTTQSGIDSGKEVLICEDRGCEVPEDSTH